MGASLHPLTEFDERPGESEEEDAHSDVEPVRPIHDVPPTQNDRAAPPQETVKMGRRDVKDPSRRKAPMPWAFSGPGVVSACFMTLLSRPCDATRVCRVANGPPCFVGGQSGVRHCPDAHSP